MDISTRISASAALYAMDKGFDGIDRIPPKARPATIAHVADEIGVARTDVLKVLAEEWMETSGRSGAQVTGSELATQRSPTLHARPVGCLGPMHARMNAMTGAGIPKGEAQKEPLTSSNSRADDLKNLVSETLASGPSDFIKNATAELEASLNAPPSKKTSQNPNRIRSNESDIHAGLQGGGKSRLNEEQPYSWGRSLQQKLEQFDAVPLQKGTTPGGYAAVDLKSIPDDDARLDLPLYRGMNSMDPATHALALTGKLIPQGTSGDYEGFKLYSHKEPLDAYEFSADPYIAMKGAGAHGFLLQTTLRDLRDAGGAEVSRKTCDSEGGFFIASPIQPKVRRITHPEGSYDLAPFEPPKGQTENVQKYGDYLARKVPQAGGWDAFLEDNPKPAISMHKRGLRETLMQVQHWSGRLKELRPNAKLPEKVAQSIQSKVDVNEPREGKAIAEKMLQELQMAFAMAQA